MGMYCRVKAKGGGALDRIKDVSGDLSGNPGLHTPFTPVRVGALERSWPSDWTGPHGWVGGAGFVVHAPAAWAGPSADSGG